MAASLIIEEESGTCRAWIHPHNGYYAGDFWADTLGPGQRRVPALTRRTRQQKEAGR